MDLVTTDNQKHFDNDQEIIANTNRLAAEILFESVTKATLSGFLVASAICFTFSKVTPHVNLRLWFFIFSITYLLRLLISKKYNKLIASDQNPLRYLMLFRALTVLCGIAWGSAGVLLYSDDVIFQALLSIILAGVSATAASVYMVDKFTNVSFLIAALFFTPVMLFLNGNHISTTIAFSLIVFGIYSLAINFSNGKKFLEIIKLRFEAQQSKEMITTLSERHRLHIQHTPLAVIEWDRNLKITFWNNAAERMFGYSAEQALGKSLNLFVTSSHIDLIQNHLSSLMRGLSSSHDDTECISQDGIIINCEWFNTVLHDTHGNINGIASLIQDQTAYLLAKREIEALAYLDTLTQLANRRLLMNRLEHAISKNIRKKTIGSLIFIDIDKYKQLNDNYGHRMGDLLLCEIAKRLKKILRNSDTIARFGGDEFVLMIEEIHTDYAEAQKASQIIAEKVIDCFSEAFFLDHLEYHCTASIGITLFDATTTKPDEVIRHADIAMYQSKHNGRNSYHFYDESLQSQVDSRAQLMNELQTALGAKQFKLHFQPQVDMNRNIQGAEILLRWVHPKRGNIPPAEFIPLAEESKMIVPIGGWVLQEACNQLKQWEASSKTKHLTLSVNVSAIQFSQVNFVEQVTSAINKSNCNPKKLILELTESAIVHQIEDVIEKMMILKKIGITFSMDDFGVGYSSLSVLKRLPLDELKIDRSFVSDLPDNKDSATIAHIIIAMGSGLSLDIIAEGIENEAQETFLKQSGCKSFQGYFYCKPVAVEQFMNMLPSSSEKANVINQE